jgi:hypothetical protein
VRRCTYWSTCSGLHDMLETVPNQEETLPIRTATHRTTLATGAANHRAIGWLASRRFHSSPAVDRTADSVRPNFKAITRGRRVLAGKFPEFCDL